MRSILSGFLVAGSLAVSCGQAHADAASSLGSGGIAAQTGPEIYQHVCQGCHMPGGRGAVGAAAFPALAGNPKLASKVYPIYVLLHGYGGMPWFNGMLSPAQIAAVVNYIRGNFGNHYPDQASPADVTALQGPAPVAER